MTVRAVKLTWMSALWVIPALLAPLVLTQMAASCVCAHVASEDLPVLW